MKSIDEIISVKNFSTGYNSNPILSNVNFTMQPGDFLSIIGQNGSGKSTLLKGLTGFLPASNGKVEFFGNHANGMLPHNLVENGISLMFQGGGIIPNLTVNEHLTLARGKNNCKSERFDLEAINCQFPQIISLRNKLAGNLSGGERQMLTFSLLLLQNTKFWLLDEPTAGLSPEIVDQTADFLAKKNKEEKITICMIEHNLDFAFSVSSHVAIVRDGSFLGKFSEIDFKKIDFLNKYFYN